MQKRVPFLEINGVLEKNADAIEPVEGGVVKLAVGDGRIIFVPLLGSVLI
jgi:hypothetical protein